MDQNIHIPRQGEKIHFQGVELIVPNHPIIPFIEGDGIGVDITPLMMKVVDVAVRKAYGEQKQIHWMEIYAGDKARARYSEPLPLATLEALKTFVVAIKGPLGTPVGGGLRSLNVALRQALDLFVCLRPIRYFKGTPSPLRHPEHTNMVIFRENAEDIYAGIEWEADSEGAKQVLHFLQTQMGVNFRFSENCGVGIKPISKAGTIRLVRSAVQYAIDQDLPSVTLVHKGNIMKYTEGAFKNWGYELARNEFGAQDRDGQCVLRNPKKGNSIIIKDVIADAFFQQILLRPGDYSVIATMNLNGDYISDALAAQVGGIGMAPGANLGSNVFLFEATHGTAPGYAGQDKVNPSSLILSAEMMLRHMSWFEAADYILKGIQGAIAAKKVTYDLARLMPDKITPLSGSGFAEAIIDNMN